VAEGQNHNGIKWSLGFCQFWGTLDFEIMADLLSAGLGESVPAAELATAGERIWNLSRLFNLRAGFSVKDDALPEKVMKRKLEKGPHAGRVFSQEDFETARQKYYAYRDWDENGVPSQQKLAELGLDSF
jgi:aldehyde:ferredoxin oxidoreductase